VTTSQTLHQHLTNGTITAKEHQALHLYDVKKLSYRQIALGLNLAPTTVTDRIRRARQKINYAERNAA
jgi:DNA-directed RNA polymerase specialized sigma24 family protein